MLGAIAFFVAVGYGILAPAIPDFAREFGVGRTAAALVISVFALMWLLSAFSSGGLVDRFGERPVLAIGIWIVAERGRASGTFAGGFLAGGIVGPVFGGPLTEVSLRLPFFVYAGTLTLAALVAMVALRKPATPGFEARLDLVEVGGLGAGVVVVVRVLSVLGSQRLLDALVSVALGRMRPKPVPKPHRVLSERRRSLADVQDRRLDRVGRGEEPLGPDVVRGCDAAARDVPVYAR